MAEQRSFRVDMEKLVAVSVANRLSDPRSKLGLLEWVETVALPGVEKAQVTHSNLLRAMNFIIAHKEQLEQELASTLLPLFARELDTVMSMVRSLAKRFPLQRVVVAYSPPGGVPHGASAAPRKLSRAVSLALRRGRRLEAQDEGRRQRGRPLSDVGAVVALREHLARHTLSRFFTVS